MTVAAPEAPTAGTLQRLARQYAAKLEAGDLAASQEMLAAWSDAYWAVRTDLDALITYVTQARAAGQTISPSWLSRERRLKAVLAQAAAELDRYAVVAARHAADAQTRALVRALVDGPALIGAAINDQLPGLSVDLLHINPKVLETAVGFLRDGSPLIDHLAKTVMPDAIQGLRQTLIRGLAKGWGQDKLVRDFTQAFAFPHVRAVTIMRTESLRYYREASRDTYETNRHVVASWTWQCAFDARSCVSCIAMSGTRHPVTETLDDHPRGRCAMIPETKTWAELGHPDVAETRPAIQTGADWLANQRPAFQRGIMGPLKYDLWKSGRISLADMVARSHDPVWGTMRTERSVKSILEGRNANWGGLDGVLGPAPVGVS